MIDIEGNRIRIETGRGRVEKVWEMDRAWTQVELRPVSYRWDEKQLVLRSREREVTLGSFLDPEEKVSLARELKRCVGPMARCGSGFDIPDAAPAAVFRTVGDKAG